MLTDKVVIITGAAKGLGEAQAAECARNGALLVLTDVDPEIDAVATRYGERAIAVRHDVAQRDEWDYVVDRTLAAFGRIDGLVNNAGIGGLVRSIETVTVAEMQLLWKINTLGPMHGMQAVIPAMKEQGGGAIVNISSAAAMRGTVDLMPYSVSKWALRGMSRCAARDLAPHNIRVNTVFPGITRTQLAARNEVMMEEGVRTIPLGRIGEPDEIASHVAFLLSDKSSFATGGEFLIDGGRGC